MGGKREREINDKSKNSFRKTEITTNKIKLTFSIAYFEMNQMK